MKINQKEIFLKQESKDLVFSYNISVLCYKIVVKVLFLKNMVFEAVCSDKRQEWKWTESLLNNSK